MRSFVQIIIPGGVKRMRCAEYELGSLDFDVTGMQQLKSCQRFSLT